jgi:hypothetical protein
MTIKKVEKNIFICLVLFKDFVGTNFSGSLHKKHIHLSYNKVLNLFQFIIHLNFLKVLLARFIYKICEKNQNHT